MDLRYFCAPNLASVKCLQFDVIEEHFSWQNGQKQLLEPWALGLMEIKSQILKKWSTTYIWYIHCRGHRRLGLRAVNVDQKAALKWWMSLLQFFHSAGGRHGWGQDEPPAPEKGRDIFQTWSRQIYLSKKASEQWNLQRLISQGLGFDYPMSNKSGSSTQSSSRSRAMCPVWVH